MGMRHGASRPGGAGHPGSGPGQALSVRGYDVRNLTSWPAPAGKKGEGKANAIGSASWSKDRSKKGEAKGLFAAAILGQPGLLFGCIRTAMPLGGFGLLWHARPAGAFPRKACWRGRATSLPAAMPVLTACLAHAAWIVVSTGLTGASRDGSRVERTGAGAAL